MEEKETTKDYLMRKFQYKIGPDYLEDYLAFYHAKEQVLQKEKCLTKKLEADILERAKIQQPIKLKNLVLNGDDIIQYFQLSKKYASQREFIGLCLRIIRERTEIYPQINRKQDLFTILENLNRIVSQCTTQVTRQVRVVSTDHIRKLYRDGSPEYVRWENEHTYQLAKWLILCLLRKDPITIIIFDGTNFNMPNHPNHRESLANRFRKYNPLFINVSATEEEAKLNANARDHEKSSIKKSDADLTIFRRYQELIRTYPRALSTPKEYESIQISPRHPKFSTLIRDVISKIKQNNYRFIVMSGNVLTGKTYTAYVLQKHLEATSFSNI